MDGETAYQTLWTRLRIAAENGTLDRAAVFYAQSPDGQYDELASMAIQAVLQQIERDKR